MIFLWKLFVIAWWGEGEVTKIQRYLNFVVPIMYLQKHSNVNEIVLSKALHAGLENFWFTIALKCAYWRQKSIFIACFVVISISHQLNCNLLVTSKCVVEHILRFSQTDAMKITNLSHQLINVLEVKQQNATISF